MNSGIERINVISTTSLFVDETVRLIDTLFDDILEKCTKFKSYSKIVKYTRLEDV